MVKIGNRNLRYLYTATTSGAAINRQHPMIYNRSSIDSGFVIFVLGYSIRAKIIITDKNAIKKWEEIAKKRGSFEYLLNGFIANSNLWFVKGSGVKTFSIIGVIIMFLGLILLIVNK